MHELVGTQTMTNLWQSLASAATTAMLARQLAEHADVEGQPEAAVALRALADRESGLATGLVDFLVEAPDGLGDAAAGLNHLKDGRGPAAASFRGMADEARAESLDEVGAWLDKLADAQHDHELRLTAAIDGLR
jgi:rubrerythrin